MKQFLSFLLCVGVLLSVAGTAQAQVSGTVFRDFNANGVKDNTATFNEVFEANVVVTAYNSANTIIASYKTNASGVFTIPASGAVYNGTLGSNTGFVAAATAVRIEFTSLGTNEYSAVSGASNNSSVQFVTAPTASVVFGAAYPEDYYGTTNPKVIFPSYRNGVSSSNEDPGLVAVNYNSNGFNSYYSDGNGVPGTGPVPKMNASVAEIGTTWGAAYHNALKRSYHATFLKRHSGVADGFGYIYVMDQTKTFGALAGKFNLQGVVPTNGGAALDFGTVNRTGADYALSTDKLSPSIDLDAFGKIGKIGYGDIDMQPGTNTLWAVNVFENSLIAMDISGAPSAVPATVNRYTLLGRAGYPVSVKGLLHPWALAFHHGYGYLGVTDDASITKVNTDLKCYVLRFDPNNMAAGFTQVLAFDPNTHTVGVGSEMFQYWLNAYAEPPVVITAGGNTHFHQPMFSDIEFDTDESLVLSVMDREGHQYGSENYKPVSGTTVTNIVIAYGTILKACGSGTSYTIEGGSGCGSAAKSYSDVSGDGDNAGSLGGTILIPGMGQIISTYKDPFPGTGAGVAYENSQGLQTFNTTTGAMTNFYTKNIGTALPFLGKAAGLGDLEAIGLTPPIEIGNRVWADANSDGIQDAGEAGIGNVTIDLYADFDNNNVPDVVAAAAACAYNLSATSANAACSGTTAWVTATNAATVNGVGATVTLPASGVSQCLQVSSLGFAIPATATITGVTVNISRKAAILSKAIDNSVKLLVGGAVVGSNKAKAASVTYLDTYANSVYGNSADMWGTTLTPAQVNAGNFGVSLNVGRTSTGSVLVSVDAIEVNVCYTTAAGATFTATTTTATSGNIGTWYFNATNVPDGDPSTAGNQPGLAPNKKYIVRVASANIPSGKTLTTANVGGAGQPDVRDSDASLVGGNVEIAYTTGTAGQNDHTLDMGFIATPPTLTLNVTSTGSCSCSNATGYMNVTGLSNLSAGVFSPSGTYNNVPLPAYGTVDISYNYTGAGTATVPDFRNLDITQGFGITTDYSGLGYPSTGTVPGLRNKIAAGQTGTLTYSFDQPVKEVNLAVFDVDWDDNVTVTAWDAYGNLITDFSGWSYQTGDLTVPATASIASWNAATHVISSTSNTDGERNFSLLKPNVYISKASFAFTGTTDPNANSPHTQYTIFSNLQAAQICQAAATVSVAYTNPPAGQSITVTNGGMTQTIASGLASPQTVTLPYPPDGTGPHTITASFTGGVPATATTTYTNISCYGSVGNYVWKDANGNGLNDDGASAGINGVTVELWNNTTNSLVATTTTATNAGSAGYYNFLVTANGNYYVHFPTTSGTLVLTTQTATAATDGNSDADASGNSPVFTINIAGTGTAKDNPTLDAGYRCNVTAGLTKSGDLTCAAPTATLTATPATGATYAWSVGASPVAATNTATVSTAGTYTVTVTETATSCSATANVTVANNMVAPSCIPITVMKTQ